MFETPKKSTMSDNYFGMQRFLKVNEVSIYAFVIGFLVIVICFGFRVSDFGFILLKDCFRTY